MKISGFTIIKNALHNDYPVVEAIESILPLVDEMIVSIGNSTDDTVNLIRNIASDKIRIIHSVWDISGNNMGGSALAVETDKAFREISPDSDWAFYIQADEVLHEKYHGAIRMAAEKYKDDKTIDGLLFNYLHFFGTYDYVGDSRRWYNKEVRIIRNDKTITAYRDAQGFRRKGEKLYVKQVDAYIYHYGWVKSPKQMQQKNKNIIQLYAEREHAIKRIHATDVFDFNEFDSLERFSGTHPSPMKKRIAEKNWDVQMDITRKKFSMKDRLLYFIEKRTGVRLFNFRNYRII
ncbi:MAG: glycosyltransferase family 2 protein [Chitinophagaceae bacterium]|nr:MAG: glycosyltransferase family 2 protein [Chitinophagaceae bacterium]